MSAQKFRTVKSENVPLCLEPKQYGLFQTFTEVLQIVPPGKICIPEVVFVTAE